MKAVGVPRDYSLYLLVRCAQGLLGVTPVGTFDPTDFTCYNMTHT